MLTAMALQSLDKTLRGAVAAALRARHPEPEMGAGFLGGPTRRCEDRLADVLHRTGPHLSLPTYAFQRERYWLSPDSGISDPAASGLGRLDHPLLAGAVSVGDRDEWLLTGQLSMQTQPWLAEHVLLGNVVVPGTAFVELALAAGRQAGAAVVEELVIEAPLILQAGIAVALQVTVGEPDDDGRREVAIYTRPESGSSGDAT